MSDPYAYHVGCEARRRDGGRCENYAAHGDRLCSSHGGVSHPTANTTELRAQRRAISGQVATEYDAYRERLAAWQQERAVVVAELLGMDAADVTPMDIAMCRSMHGVPADEQPPAWR